VVTGKAEKLPPGGAPVPAPAPEAAGAGETGTVADVESIARQPTTTRGGARGQGRRTTSSSSSSRENDMRRQDPYSTRTRTSRGTFATAADTGAGGPACAPRATTSGLLGLVGGAGLGAVLMYLLDPAEGRERRAHLAETTTHAAEGAADAVAPVWAGAKLIGKSLAERAHDLAERSRELASSAAEGTASAGSFLSDRASDAGSGIRRGSRRAARTTKSWFGYEEEPRYAHYVPSTSTTVSALAALAAGVGLMYLMDPQDGNRRRAVLRDKSNRLVRETGDFFRKTGRHLANKSRGMQHQAAGMVSRGEEPTDRQLAERIRASVGHYGLRANYDVLADRGRVTLIGQCSPDDVNRLLGAVHAVPGVMSIVNQLDVRADFDPAGSIYRASTGTGSIGVTGTSGTSTNTGGPIGI